MPRKREKVGNPPLLLDWLREGLGRGAGQKSQAGLAEALGLHPSQVSLMMRDEREVRVSELPAIAAYLGKRPPAGMLVEPSDVKRSPTSGVGIEEALPARVRVEVVIAPGVWRELGANVALLQERIAPSSDPRLQGMKQYACKIEADGRYAVCVRFKDMRSEPRPSDTVHVRRIRGDVYEDTLRIVRVVRGHVELHLTDSGKDKKPLIYPSRDPDETLELRGLVVGYFTPATF